MEQSPILNQYSLVVPVTPSEKVQLTPAKSLIRAFQFPMYIAHKPPKRGGGGQKRKTAVFRLKSHFA